jgi:ABC-type phosphate transport system ATPase subunit
MNNDFNDCYTKALQLVSSYNTLNNELNDASSKKEEYKTNLKNKLEEQMNYEDAISYLKDIIQVLSRQHIDYIEKLLDSAVKTIFYDKSYSIKMEISEFRNNNVLDIYLIETTDEGEIKTNIKSNGFGLQSIVGFILQIYFIIYNKLEPILFMDEALSAISTQYLPYVKELINTLAKKYNFTFILVAHDSRFIDIADYKYEIQNGELVN